MSEEFCQNCRFWKYRQDLDDDGEEIKEDMSVPGNLIGLCRRNPPQVVSAYFELRRQYDFGSEWWECDDLDPPPAPGEAAFPLAWGSDWCGEYQPATI